MSTHRDRNESGSSVTMFDGRLERVRTTEFGVGDNQANGPIDLDFPQLAQLSRFVATSRRTVTVKTINKMMPMVIPACRKAYGWPCQTPSLQLTTCWDHIISNL